jgi:branched-subunit amino acid ABC-type transport system permease component
MEQPGQSGRSPATRITVAVLLLIGALGPLAVPLYRRTSPELGGWPFFYWYQIIWIPVTAILLTAAYLVLRRTGAGNGTNGTEADR